jgi:CubicO group peptidase (beta-lactamase class C family)
MLRSAIAFFPAMRRSRCVVVAYYKGREVVHVGGGVHRPCSGVLKPLPAPGTAAGMTPGGGGSAWAAVEADTRFMIQSVTKGVVACGVGALVDQGLLDYDHTVASYWPAFGCEGKDALTVASALSHRAGLCSGMLDVVPLILACLVHFGLTKDALSADRWPGRWLGPWRALGAKVARATPSWVPGSFAAYHAVTYR